MSSHNLAMAQSDDSADLAAILYQIHHVFLPPQLPQEYDEELSHQKGLIDVISVAMSEFRRCFSLSPRSELEYAEKMVRDLIDMRDAKGFLDPHLVGERLLALEPLDTLTIHVTCQNAGLLIRKLESEYIFESMELLARDEAVMACEGRLIRLFPGPSIAVEACRISDASFRSVLVDTLVRLDRETESDYSGHTETDKEDTRPPKGKVDNLLDTPSPRLITGMLVAVLRAMGRSVDTPCIRKHTREEVLLRKGGKKPWRRSPLWLLVRVSLQLCLDRLARELKAPDSLYKPFMAYLMASILCNAAERGIPHDILYVMAAKISQRVLKIDPSESAPWLPDVEKTMSRVDSALRQRWDRVARREKDSMDLSDLSDLEFDGDTALSLQRLHHYLDQVGRPPPPHTLGRPGNPLGPRFQRNRGRHILPQQNFTNNPELIFFELAEFEQSMKTFLCTDVEPAPQDPGQDPPDLAFSPLGFRREGEGDNDNFIYAKFPVRSKDRETRLVTIEPASFHQTIRCHLTATRLGHQCPAFEALSYVWGDRSEADVIRLNGHLFGVTKNLAAALRHLRSPSEERVMWIDAICINQKNKSERSAQVRLMGDIYHGATRVISWLGESVARDMMVARRFLDAVASAGDLERIIGNMMGKAEKYQAREVTGVWEAVEAIERCFQGATTHLERQVYKPLPYWHRTWITQEVRLARSRVFQSQAIIIEGDEIENYCSGSRELRGFLMEFGKENLARRRARPDQEKQGRRGWKLLQLNSHILSLEWVRYGSPAAPGCDSQQQETLLELLESGRHKSATDPRDKVFGLIGLVDPKTASHPGLRIDYERSIRDVYIGAAQAAIESTRNLDIIYSRGSAKSTPALCLPTWAPDWSIEAGEGYQAFTAAMRGEMLPSSPTLCETRFSLDGGAEILSARGVCFGEVTGSCSHQMGGLDWESNIRGRVKCYRTLAELALPLKLSQDSFVDTSLLPAHGSRIDEFKETLLEYLQDGKAAEDPEYSALRKFNSEELDVIVSVESYKSTPETIAVARQRLADPSSDTSDPRAFAVVGLCPYAKQGDLVCLFPGCSRPVVLRSIGGQQFEVVGAFVSAEPIFRHLIDEGLRPLGALRWFDLR